MITAGLHEKLLGLLNEQLEKAGYLVKRTTLIESSRKRPDQAAAREGQAPDADAGYTRKNGKSYYGYKAHVGADGQNHLISAARITSASVYDSLVFSELIAPQTRAVYADKAYDSKANRAWLAARGMLDGILKKGAHHIKLTATDQEANARKGKCRRHIERVFAHLKTWQHYRRVRYLGLVKNQLELTLKAVAYNLKRMVALATA